MDGIIAFLGKVPGWLQAIGYAISIIMFAWSGIKLQGGRKHAEDAKDSLPRIVIGLGLVFLAATVAATIRSAAG